MNVVIVPGYGDVDGYIHRATRNWEKKYGLKPEIIRFGWYGEADSYVEKWQAFVQKLENIDETAIIGVSAGASVALRALLAYPNKITKVVTICGPVHPEKMNPETLHDKYPILERYLENLSLDGLPADRVMTMRPLYDEVVNTKAMVIDGAQNKQMKMISHPISVAWAMFVNAKRMARFINS